MLIPRPTHNDYWITDTPVVSNEPTEDQSKHCAWVKWFFEQIPWKCYVCGAKIVYSCEYCVCCKFMYHRHTPKPTTST